ncbi:MAG: dTMP kinase [Candidatus Aenigmatarchaeota archaeon]
MPGKFIVFEGLDGSGITTQATLLRNFFISKGKDAILTKEPTDGLIGGLIKACLRSEWKTSPNVMQMLFAADRAHHLETEIEPNLKKNKIIICDRYVLSSLAYGSLEVPTKMLQQLNLGFRKPNITILVDTQPRICLDRIKRARPHLEIFEDETKFEQIRKNYFNLKSLFPETYVIDGNREPEEILENIKKVVAKEGMKF